jgi:hypothetical protein
MTLFSFSVFIIVVLILIGRIDWKKWSIFILLISFLVDILLHRGIGVTLLSLSLSTGVLYFLFMLVPKKAVVFSYIPYFISIFIFYISISLLNPLVQSGIIGSLTWGMVLGYFIKSLISALIIWGVSILMDNFRSDNKIIL